MNFFQTIDRSLKCLIICLTYKRASVDTSMITEGDLDDISSLGAFCLKKNQFQFCFLNLNRNRIYNQCVINSISRIAFFCDCKCK